MAEWPTGMTADWGERTVIAADDSDGGVFALTPSEDGQLRIEPLPNQAATPGGHCQH